jgi:putative DNA primase/helicase
LARLSAWDFERSCVATAKVLGVSAGFLKSAVKAKRAELGLNAKDDGQQGQPINFATVEPWPEPVDGAQLLDELAATIRGHIVLADHARDVIALWVIHTYVFQHFLISVKLFFRAVVKGSGKTTSLDVLGRLVARPMKSANITSAALFRVIARYQPTLLVDEVDTFAAENEELRGVLDASSRYDGHVTRVVGDNFEPHNFPVYTPIALAGLGQLHPTIMDRCIIVDLPKRLASEPIASLRIGQTGHLDILARKIVRFVADNGERIGATEPVMPPGMINRLADNWFALLAIADIAGGTWPQRARQAALAGQVMDADEAALLETLLGDVRDILDDHGLDRIASDTLIEHLCQITPRPWVEFGRSGKPITANKLARQLRPLGITPVLMRIGTQEPARGYARHQFTEAWARYLPPGGYSNRYNVTNADTTGTSDLFQTVTAKPDVTVPKSEKSNNDGLCNVVTVRKGGDGHAEPLGLSERTLDEVAEWVQAFAARHVGEPDIDALITQALRERLRNKYNVRPEDLDIEAERVMTRAFGPLK